jgi:hypothetical protein
MDEMLSDMYARGFRPAATTFGGLIVLRRCRHIYGVIACSAATSESVCVSRSTRRERLS